MSGVFIFGWNQCWYWTRTSLAFLII